MYNLERKGVRRRQLRRSSSSSEENAVYESERKRRTHVCEDYPWLSWVVFACLMLLMVIVSYRFVSSRHQGVSSLKNSETIESPSSTVQTFQFSETNAKTFKSTVVYSLSHLDRLRLYRDSLAVDINAKCILYVASIQSLWKCLEIQPGLLISRLLNSKSELDASRFYDFHCTKLYPESCNFVRLSKDDGLQNSAQFSHLFYSAMIGSASLSLEERQTHLFSLILLGIRFQSLSTDSSSGQLAGQIISRIPFTSESTSAYGSSESSAMFLLLVHDYLSLLDDRHLSDVISILNPSVHSCLSYMKITYDHVMDKNHLVEAMYISAFQKSRVYFERMMRKSETLDMEGQMISFFLKRLASDESKHFSTDSILWLWFVNPKDTPHHLIQSIESLSIPYETSLGYSTFSQSGTIRVLDQALINQIGIRYGIPRFIENSARITTVLDSSSILSEEFQLEKGAVSKDPTTSSVSIESMSYFVQYSLSNAFENQFRGNHRAISQYVSQYVSLMDTSGTFQCFDGSGSIDLSFLNDDYCDCPDGSDEPTTSACSKVSAMNSFTCNSGEHIHVSWVGDGLCDCCDGSDELNVHCLNTC